MLTWVKILGMDIQSKAELITKTNGNMIYYIFFITDNYSYLLILPSIQNSCKHDSLLNLMKDYLLNDMFFIIKKRNRYAHWKPGLIQNLEGN